MGVGLTIGDRIGQAIADNDLKKTELAVRVEKEVKSLFPTKVKGTNITEKKIRDWEKGRTDLLDFQIVALSNVLGVSVDWLLRGNEKNDQNVVDDIGLSGRTLQCLRADKLEDEGRYRINQLLGDTWPQVVSFFFDNGYAGLLLALRDYITRDIRYEMFMEDEAFGIQEHKILPQMTEEKWTYLLGRELLQEIEKARAKYQAKVNKKQMDRYLDDLKKGEKPDVETGERGRNDKETET